MDSTNKTMDPSTPVQFLKGVGPAKAKAFAKLGVETAADLLEFFPRDWVFAPETIKIDKIEPGQNVTVTGLVEQTDFHRFAKSPIFQASIADETGVCRLTWFHGQYLKNQIVPGMTISVSGKATLYKHQLQLTNPKFTVIDENKPSEKPDEGDPFSGPVYPASGKLTSTQIRGIIKPVIEQLAPRLPEFYSDEFRKKMQFMPRKDAFARIHFPDTDEQIAAVKRRLKYDELFMMQLGMALKRYRLRNFSSAQPMHRSETLDSRIRKRFPFLLTPDQDTVIEEIAADMAKSKPMNRLLQGDVGSGKTVVALYAALLAVANKAQVAIMAPTEILAGQHLISIERFLKGSNVKRALITGALTGKKRTEMTDRIRNGDIDIVVGTVALLSKDIEFANLGAVIIDEQHKFGVHQRLQLRKEKTPHCLVMTATPIPRTMAMTAFGDLDVSIIKSCPPGRGKVVTRWVKPHDRGAAYEFIRERLKAAKQAYFVYPRIEDDGTDDIKSAVREHKMLSKKIFPEFNVQLLHGQMKSQEKQNIMQEFRKRKIHALVSTVVIEVGLDIPNATIMVIENANRFGLAQLHQLRGRIGRGQSNSYCFLFADTEDETAISRLQIMTRTNDGFEIAEHDLKIRGPGELFSTRQHGLPDLKIANIIEDFDLLTLARKNAFELVEDDPMLKDSQNLNIRAAIVEKFGDKLGLVDIA